jgi:hypothetical protein
MLSRTAIVLIASFFLSVLLEAQTSQNLQQDLATVMSQQAAGSYKGGTSKFKNYCKQQPQQMLDALKPYETDTSLKVRAFAFNLVNSVAKYSPDSLVRQDAIAILCSACNDNDFSIKTNAAKNLQSYKKVDFNAGSKKTLEEIFKANPVESKHIARLIGFLEMKDQISGLQQLANEPYLTNREKWEGWLALARLGDKDAIDYVMAQIKTVPVGDDLMYQFAPDLIYTRQHKPIDYLIEIMNSDKKDCTSSNPDAEGNILCGYRIMELLAPVIVDFPLKTHASGDIDTKDYKTALQTTRKWFRDKKSKYKIKTDSF